MLAGDRDFDLWQFLAKNVHHGRQPCGFAPAEEAHGQRPFLGVSSAPRARRSGFDLRQREPGVVEKHLARSGQLDTARATRDELGANFRLQLAQLTAQRRLRRVQPALGCDRDALLLGHGDEIPEMSQLHALSIPRGYGSQTYKVFVLDARSTKCEPAETVWRICSSSSEFTRLGAIRTLGAHHGRRFRDWAGVCASDPRLRDSCRWLEVQFRAAGHEEN